MLACAGFKLDTLKKLGTVKTADGKGSLLDFLARTAHEEGKVRGLARLPSDLAAVSAARNESLDALITDVKAIERGLQQASTQVELAAKSAAGAGGKLPGDKFESVMRPFVDGAAVAVKRLVEDSGKLSTAFKDLVKCVPCDGTNEATHLLRFYAAVLSIRCYFNFRSLSPPPILTLQCLR